METTGDKMHRIFGEALRDPNVTPSGLIIEAMRRAYCRDPEEEPDHLNFDGRSWHLDGTCCGSGPEFDLIQEFK